MVRARAPRVLAAVAAVVVGLLLVPTPASAHTSVRSTTPADAATVTTAPDEVSVVFTGALLEIGSEVAVEGPEGAVAVGPVEVDGDAVTAGLDGELPDGDYEVLWRVTAEDGHPISGAFAFTVAAGGAEAAATAEAAEPEPSETPAPARAAPATLWTVVLTLVLVVVIGAALGLWTLLRRRRRRTDHQPR